MCQKAMPKLIFSNKKEHLDHKEMNLAINLAMPLTISKVN
jgi:hypothetical protein